MVTETDTSRRAAGGHRDGPAEPDAPDTVDASGRRSACRARRRGSRSWWATAPSPRRAPVEGDITRQGRSPAVSSPAATSRRWRRARGGRAGSSSAPAATSAPTMTLTVLSSAACHHSTTRPSLPVRVPGLGMVSRSRRHRWPANPLGVRPLVARHAVDSSRPMRRTGRRPGRRAPHCIGAGRRR